MTAELKAPETPEAEAGVEMPFMQHLVELRSRLVKCALAWVAGFSLCYWKAEWLFELLSAPVRAALPEGSSLVFLTATEPFFTFLKVGAMAGLLLALPVIFWQIWGFIAPGLYSHEKKYAIPFVFFSTLCFVAGTWFGFTWVFPTVFTFLIGYGTSIAGISASLSIASYLSLSVQLLMAFGVVFELPIIITFLARLGVVDYAWLAKQRKYAVLVAFIVGAILTPPDVVSQTALAIPCIILYEVGIWSARLFGKRKPATEAEEALPPAPTQQ